MVLTHCLLNKKHHTPSVRPHTSTYNISSTDGRYLSTRQQLLNHKFYFSIHKLEITAQ